MEKYLIIIILVVLAYYLHRYCIQIEIKKILKTKEGFADTINTSDPDLVKSITTLGQVCKDLQAGGLTVPGALNIKSVINTDGDITTKGAINATGDINAKGVINATGDINAGGNINLKKNIFLGDGKQDWGSVVSIRGGVNDNGYLEFKNKEDERQCYLMGKPDGAYFSKNLTVDGNITVNGEVNRNNPIYRKHDIAGYYSILEKGYKIPLYYGINMTMIDWKAANTFRTNYKYPVNCAGLDMRQYNNDNFTNGNLVVFPSYKVKLYFWDKEGHLYSNREPYEFGEHGFSGHPNAAHAIWVTYKEDSEPPRDLYW